MLFFLFSLIRLVRKPSATIISLLFLMSRNEVSDHLTPLSFISLHQHDPCLLSVERVLFLRSHSAIPVNMRKCVNMMSTAWAVFTTLQAVVGLCRTSILSQEVLTSCAEDMWRVEVLYLCFNYRNSIFCCRRNYHKCSYSMILLGDLTARWTSISPSVSSFSSYMRISNIYIRLCI